MSTKYLKLPTAVILGGVGWLAIVYPQSRNLSFLITSGLRTLHTLITGGTLTDPEAINFDMSVIVIGPLAAALALLTFYGESLGSWGPRSRRAASCIVAVLLLASAAAVIWQHSLMDHGFPPPGTSVATRWAGAILNCVFLCSWALFFGVLASTTSPFRSSFMRAIVGLLAVEAAFFITLLLYLILGHWHFSRLLANAISLSPYILMLIFLLVARQESATPPALPD